MVWSVVCVVGFVVCVVAFIVLCSTCVARTVFKVQNTVIFCKVITYIMFSFLIPTIQ